MSQIDTLLAKLRASADAYHNGEALISDAEFDALEAELKRLDPQNPYFKTVGAPVKVSGWAKVSHDYPMLSLNKAQTEDEMRVWGNRFPNAEFILMWKYDGVSLSILYKDGNLVRASTRGDGEIGEDITTNVLKMRGVPHRISDTATVHVRGEIVCRRSIFRDRFADTSANPRNFASGTSKRYDGANCDSLEVVAYDLKGHDLTTREAVHQYLKTQGFLVADITKVGSLTEIQDFYLNLQKIRDEFDMDTDGMVIALNDISRAEEAGELGGRPAGAVAYKFPHMQAETTLRDIVWQVGSQGRLTPVAIFEPVQLAGATCTNASVYNLSNIFNMTGGTGFQVGAKVLAVRRNDVIPAIEKMLEQGTGAFLNAPEQCPVCSGATTMVGEYLVCTNTAECPAQTAGRLGAWIKKLNILDWGDAVLATLVETGLVSDIPDLYRLTPETLASLKLSGRVLGASAAKRLCDNLHAKKALTVSEFLGSLSIPLWGNSMFAILAGQMKNPTLEGFRALTVKELCGFEGIQERKAQALVEGLEKAKAQIEELLAVGVSIVSKSSDGALVGKVFCFTGFRDKAKQDALVALGAEIKDSYTKSVTHLVAKSTAGSSAKLDKARKDGANVISIAELDEILAQYPVIAKAAAPVELVEVPSLTSELDSLG